VAIIQISRIQTRTGNLSDLPQLSAGEFGWADDARRLFIGNDISRTGDQSPNNTEVLTQYSNISFNQVASVVNPQNWDVIQYDAGNAAWVNRQIYLDDAAGSNNLTIHGNLSVLGNIFNISNSTLKLSGGSSGDVLTTDGTGNLIWAAGGGGGGGGTSFTVTAVTAGTTTPGSSTRVTVTNLAAANGDPVIFDSIVSTGNIATVLNGNVFYIGNVNVSTDTCQLYTDFTLTTGISTTGTYTSGGTMTIRNQASGAAGAVQLSDGSGHFITASGLQYSTGLQTLSSPKLSATLTTEDALSSGGGANIAGNLKVNSNANIVGNTRIGGVANVIGNLNVTGNSVITGNVALSNNASITGNISIGGTASITGNTTITGANVSLGTVANVHIGGGTSQVALAGTISIVGGVITGIAIDSGNGGAGYLSAPTVIISGPNTVPATATATIIGGVVQSPLTMTAGGAGYSAGTTSVAFSLPAPEYLTTDGRGNLAWASASDGSGAPTGTISMWPTAVPPLGYLICNGSAVSRTGATGALFGVLGTTFGVGDGSTTFNLPDYRDRFAMGAGGNIVTAAGQTGGSANSVVVAHTHTATSNSAFSGNALATHNHTATSPPHTHTITDPGHAHVMSRTLTDLNVDARFDAVSLRATTDDAEFTDRPTEISTTGISISPTTTTTTINNVSAGVPAGSVTTTTTINSAGVAATNQNLPPFLGIFFIIKV